MKIGFVNFTPLVYSIDTPYHEPLGGAESSICYLAEHLAERGHQVTLFGRFPGIFTSRKVRHEPDRNLKDGSAPALDFLVIQNTAYFGIGLRAVLDQNTKLIFWAGHAPDQPTVQDLNDRSFRGVYDAFVMISRWQLEGYLKTFGIERRKCFIAGNAISPAFENIFAGRTNPLSLGKVIPPILAYTSTPFRGLELLIDIFPKIKRQVPDATLKVFSGMQLYQVPGGLEQKEYGDLYRLCRETEGVEYIGSIPQPKLAEELRAVSVLSYPNTFPETSCIAVMEAMAAGCQIITSNLGALSETTAGFAKLIPVTSGREQYINDFVQETVTVLEQFRRRDRGLMGSLARQVNFANGHYTWGRRAEEWESWLGGLNFS